MPSTSPLDGLFEIVQSSSLDQLAKFCCSDELSDFCCGQWPCNRAMSINDCRSAENAQRAQIESVPQAAPRDRILPFTNRLLDGSLHRPASTSHGQAHTFAHPIHQEPKRHLARPIFSPQVDFFRKSLHQPRGIGDTRGFSRHLAHRYKSAKFPCAGVLVELVETQLSCFFSFWRCSLVDSLINRSSGMQHRTNTTTMNP